MVYLNNITLRITLAWEGMHIYIQVQPLLIHKTLNKLGCITIRKYVYFLYRKVMLKSICRE